MNSSDIPTCNNKEGAATAQMLISDYVPFRSIHNTAINVNSRIVESHYQTNPIQTYLPFDCEQYLTLGHVDCNDRGKTESLSPWTTVVIQFFSEQN
jgi:hypothetical protein